MKKAIALLATLVVLTSTTFAQLAPSISGYGEVKWGTDLEDETNGFSTDTSVTVTIPLTSGEEKSVAGEGAHGAASITGTTLTIDLNATEDNDNGDDNEGDIAGNAIVLGDITAKIDFANGAYMTVGSSDDVAADMVESNDDDYRVSPDFNNDGAGVTFGYAKDALSLALTVKNETDGYEGYQADATETVASVDAGEFTQEVDNTEVDAPYYTASTEDAYYVGVAVAYDAGDILKAELAFGTTGAGTEDGTTPVIEDDAETATLVAEAVAKTAVSVKLTSIPVEGVTVTVPFDYYTQDLGTAMEARPVLAFAAAGVTASVDVHYISIEKDLISLADDYTNTKINAKLGYALSMDAGTVALDVTSNNVTDEPTLEPTISFTAPTWNVKAEIADVLADDLGDIDVTAGFTGVEGVTVAAATTIYEGLSDTSLQIDFAEAFTSIENTVFTVKFYDFSSKTDAEDAGAFYVGAKISL